MNSNMASPGPRRSKAALARDAALGRIVRTRRGVIGAAAALTAGIAALVSAVAPGHSLASKTQAATTASTSGVTTARGSSSSSSLPRMPAPANPGDLGLQGPQQAPSPSPAPQPQSQPQSQP